MGCGRVANECRCPPARSNCRTDPDVCLSRFQVRCWILICVTTSACSSRKAPWTTNSSRWSETTCISAPSPVSISTRLGHQKSSRPLFLLSPASCPSTHKNWASCRWRLQDVSISKDQLRLFFIVLENPWKKCSPPGHLDGDQIQTEQNFLDASRRSFWASSLCLCDTSP